MRRALANFAAQDVGPVDDLGDVPCEGDALEAAQEAYAAAAAAALAAGSLVIGLGGGHEIAWASYLALAQRLDQEGSRDAVGVVNVDAHFDLRGDERASSGTPFRQILEHGRAHGREVGYCCLGISRWSNTAALFERARALGVDPALVDRLIGMVAGSGRLAIADVAELAPRFDPDGRTARIAARYVARMAEAARR